MFVFVQCRVFSCACGLTVPLSLSLETVCAIISKYGALVCKDVQMMCAEMLKKVARPASNWKALSPSLEPWFEELDSILKTIQVIERGESGKSASERAREIHSP